MIIKLSPNNKKEKMSKLIKLMILNISYWDFIKID